MISRAISSRDASRSRPMSHPVNAFTACSAATAKTLTVINANTISTTYDFVALGLQMLATPSIAPVTHAVIATKPSIEKKKARPVEYSKSRPPQISKIEPPMSHDDESIMHSLVHHLDIDSAAKQFLNLGFTLIYASAARRRFIRAKGSTVEGITLDINADHHLCITQSENGIMGERPQHIASWDEWIVYVRMLTYRTQTMAFRKRAELLEESSKTTAKCELL